MSRVPSKKKKKERVVRELGCIEGIHGLYKATLLNFPLRVAGVPRSRKIIIRYSRMIVK